MLLGTVSANHGRIQANYDLKLSLLFLIVFVYFLMKDGIAFGWSYYQFGSIFIYNHNFAKLTLQQKEMSTPEEKAARQEKSIEYNMCINDHTCRRLAFLRSVLYYVFGLWSRFAEIGVRISFMVFATIAAFLFNELDMKVDEFVEKMKTDPKRDEQENVSLELETWKNQYDLVCRFVEQINRSFGFFLLIITGIDFATSILEFYNILAAFDFRGLLQNLTEEDLNYKAIEVVYDTVDQTKTKVIGVNSTICIFRILHHLLRFLFILVASNDLGTKVQHFFTRS